MPAPHATVDAPGSALAVLAAEHRAVRALFAQFAQFAQRQHPRGADDDDDDSAKAALVDDICQALTLHAMLEEELFYPALRAVPGAAELLDEADVEHAGARELVARLQVMYPGDDHFDATVSVLADEVAHHIDQEEGELFELARGAGLNLDALGARLAARRAALDDDPTAAPGGADALTPHAGTRHPPRVPD